MIVPRYLKDVAKFLDWDRTALFSKTLSGRKITLLQCESAIAFIFQKWSRVICKKYRGLQPVHVIWKLFVSTLIRL